MFLALGEKCGGGRPRDVYPLGFVSTICVPSEGKQHEFKMLTWPLTSKWSTVSLRHTVQHSPTAYTGQASKLAVP